MMCSSAARMFLRRFSNKPSAFAKPRSCNELVGNACNQAYLPTRELFVALAPANEQTISDRDLRYITSFVDSLDIALLSSDKITPTTSPLASIVQRFSFGTVVCIFFWLVAKMLCCEASLRLVTAIDNRNVRLNVTCQEPSYKLSTSICLICCQMRSR
jgi:hypothetical protein